MGVSWTREQNPARPFALWVEGTAVPLKTDMLGTPGSGGAAGSQDPRKTAVVHLCGTAGMHDCHRAAQTLGYYGLAV